MRIFWYTSPQTSRRICYCDIFPREAKEREALIEFSRAMESWWRNPTPPARLNSFRLIASYENGDGIPYAVYEES